MITILWNQISYLLPWIPRDQYITTPLVYIGLLQIACVSLPSANHSRRAERSGNGALMPGMRRLAWSGLAFCWGFASVRRFPSSPRSHENFEAEIHVANVDVPDVPYIGWEVPASWWQKTPTMISFWWCVFLLLNEIMFLEKRFRISKTLRWTYPPTKPRGTFLLSLWSSNILVFHGALAGDVLRCWHYVTSTGFL